MSHSDRKHRVIWRKAPGNDDPSSPSLSTPSIRPSNSFMERILRDCLKPKLIAGERTPPSGGRDRAHYDYGRTSYNSDGETTTLLNEMDVRRNQFNDYRRTVYSAERKSIFRRGDKSTRYRPTDRTHIPVVAIQTPIRRAKSTNDQPREYRLGALPTPRRGNVRTVGFRKTKGSVNFTPTGRTLVVDPRDFRSFTGSANSTPTRRASDFQSMDFRRITTGSATTTPTRSVTDVPFRDFTSVTGRAKRTPTRRVSDFKPRSIRRITGSSTITPPLRVADVPFRDFKEISDSAKITPPRSFSAFQHKDFRRITVDPKNTLRRSGEDYPTRVFGQKNVEPETITPRSDSDFRPSQVQNIFTHPSSPPLPISSFQEEREQALRDYKVTIEYKHLKSHAPGGVYLIPSLDSLRDFYGIIFVRRGPFTNGIFKFRLSLPPKYNDTNMWPNIIFSSRVYNPYVDEKTGKLDVESAYPTWDPSRHYLVTVLTYLKKIFYSKNFSDAKANVQAKELAETDPQAYKKNVEACVHESQKKVYVNEKGSTAQFTEEQVAHRVLRDLLKHHIRNDSQVTKQVILSQVEKARKV